MSRFRYIAVIPKRFADPKSKLGMIKSFIYPETDSADELIILQKCDGEYKMGLIFETLVRHINPPDRILFPVRIRHIECGAGNFWIVGVLDDFWYIVSNDAS